MRVLIVLLCITLASCAARGYKQMPWAKMSPQQAEAECAAERNSEVGGSYGHCMKAKGWQPYY